MQFTDRKVRVLIAQDESTGKVAQDFFHSQNNFEVVGTTNNGGDAIDIIIAKQPDVVILDLVLTDKDGISVLDYIQNRLKIEPKPKTIVLTNLAQESFIQKSMKLGASYYMIKPCNLDEVKERIVDLLFSSENNSQKQSLDNANAFSLQTGAFGKATHAKLVEERISTIFITVGIPANIKGYQFLREAVKLTIEKPEMINSITKQLYPSIAERFETTPSKVERAIRHAIEVAWNRGKIENINSLFGIKVYSTNEKPTNSEFIALIADKMLLEGA